MFSTNTTTSELTRLLEGHHPNQSSKAQSTSNDDILIIEDSAQLPEKSDLNNAITLENLPAELIEKIVNYLEFIEAIHLAMTSSTLQEKVLEARYVSTYLNKSAFAELPNYNFNVLNFTMEEYLQQYRKTTLNELKIIYTDEDGSRDRLVQTISELPSRHIFFVYQNTFDNIERLKEFEEENCLTSMPSKCLAETCALESCLACCTGTVGGSSLTANFCCNWGDENGLHCLRPLCSDSYSGGTCATPHSICLENPGHCSCGLCDCGFCPASVEDCKMNGIDCASDKGCFNHTGLFGLACSGLSVALCLVSAVTLGWKYYAISKENELTDSQAMNDRCKTIFSSESIRYSLFCNLVVEKKIKLPENALRMNR